MISDGERTLLAGLLGSLHPIPTQDDIWRGSPYDVPELNEKAARDVLLAVNSMRAKAAGQPYGVAVLGRAGAGKTHLLGALRERIQRDLGCFFLVSLNSGKTFWSSTALGMADGFRHDSLGWGTQHKTFFRRLTAQLQVGQGVRDAIAGDARLTRDHLDTFIKALRTHDPDVGRECQHTSRALVLQGSANFDEQDIGDLYFQSQVVDEPARSEWGLPATPRTPQDLVRDTSRLIALTRSPSVIAFDQIDLLFERATSASFSPGAADAADVQQVVSLTQGLVDLLDRTQRTLIVVSCVPDTWTFIDNSASIPFKERFRTTDLKYDIGNPDLGRRIVAKRFASTFAAHNPTPAYPTWPVKTEAFTGTESLSPRRLLRLVHEHLHRCLISDTITELDQIVAATTPTPLPPKPDDRDVDELDRKFAELVKEVDVTGAFDARLEDDCMRELLAAGLDAWINEQPAGRFVRDAQDGSQPALHARLVQVLDEETERQATWSFRAIASTSANAVISRVQKASAKSGIDSGLTNRYLALLRRGSWPSGKRTDEVTSAAVASGAVVIAPSEEELKVFAALKDMLAAPHPRLPAWLALRRPASKTELFRRALPGPATDAGEPVVNVDDRAQQGNTARAPEIKIGHHAGTGDPFRLRLTSLRRHVTIFAGSGSGKTVLIRRLVEECALQGVSAIVLDPNNDLARLGEAWPQRPDAGWGPDDADRAARYLATTEVIVWTPRVTAGRPLSFQPLPDFGAVLDSPDEFGLAVESAVEALAGRVGASGTAEKAKKRRAVLTEAMNAYARSGKTSLAGFADHLADLPHGASRLTSGRKLAHDIAEALQAEMITNPLLGGEGTAANPGVLLTPTYGKSARISVISFVGMSSLEQQQGFVSQLQMALFSWIKQHPAVDRPLGGLLVIDEAQNFAPVSGGTPSTASTILLAQQARKYGLGLILATQAPKGIHNQVSGNATTQFFGRLNVPTQIEAARDIAAAKGVKIADIGTLTSGQFYATNELVSFARVDTPLCLSYHGSPLTREEVIARAAVNR